MGDQRSRRGFTMAAADRDAVMKPHDFGQHFRPTDHRNLKGSGRLEFDIVFRNGARNHHHLSVTHLAGVMTDGDFDAHCSESSESGSLFQIRTRHPVPLLVKQFGEATHADTAHAHEVDVLDVVLHDRVSGLKSVTHSSMIC